MFQEFRRSKQANITLKMYIKMRSRLSRAKVGATTRCCSCVDRIACLQLLLLELELVLGKGGKHSLEVTSTMEHTSA